MSVEPNCRVNVDVDLEAVPICEVEWWSDDNNTQTRCTNPATWAGDAHNQTACEDGHDPEWGPIILCGECVLAALNIAVDNNGHDLLDNLRKL